MFTLKIEVNKLEKRLKRKVIISLYFVCTIMFCFGLMYIYKNLESKEEDFSYVSNVVNKEYPVTKVIDLVFTRPYNDTGVKVLSNYYDVNADSDTQQKSIIYFNNTYMPNTGVIYGGEDKFDVYSIYDGEVIGIKHSDLLGDVVTIKHSNNVISVYQLLEDVFVNRGSIVKQGDRIGSSGKSNIIDDNNYKLLLEVSIDGELVDGEKIYNKKLTDF